MNQPLPESPPHIARLPRDHRGFPIPWFVAVLADGTRDFRIADDKKRLHAARAGLCWVCGERLGRYQAFVIGPMCAVNMVTAEPPCHLECAEYSAGACPFLSRPRMRRNEDLPPGTVAPPGEFILRNPGVVCVWVCGSFRMFNADAGGWLIRLGPPRAIKWFALGQPATRAQVLASIDSGYPLLLKVAQAQGSEAVAELEQQRARTEALVARSAAP